MSRTLIILSLVGMVAIAWQLAGQETKTETKPAAKPKAVPPLQDSPYRDFWESERKAEQKILQALNKKISVEFDETPLKDVMDFIANKLDIAVIVDEVAITDEGIATDEPITLKTKDISARNVLKLFLTDRLELTWIIEDEVLKITSMTVSEEQLITRIYDISDLVPSVERVYAEFEKFNPHSSGSFCDGKKDKSETEKSSEVEEKPTFRSPRQPQPGFFAINDSESKHSQRGEREKGHHKFAVTPMDQLLDVITDNTSGPWVEIEGVGGRFHVFEHQEKQKRLLIVIQTRKCHMEIEKMLHDLRGIVND